MPLRGGRLTTGLSFVLDKDRAASMLFRLHHQRSLVGQMTRKIHLNHTYSLVNEGACNPVDGLPDIPIYRTGSVVC